jgi:hypothetical protein
LLALFVGWGMDFEGEEADAFADLEACLDEGKGDVGRPAIVGPVRGVVGIDGLGV